MRQKHAPTAEQKLAIDSVDKKIAIVAAAGSGKTFVLTERYLRHVVEEGLRPDQILTITFTLKAASEMRSRIVSALRDLERFNDAQVAETGPIQTIHSFCERFLKENSLEAGIDPNFEITDESQADRILLGCIREALADLPEEDEEVAQVVTFMSGKSTFGSASPYGVLEKAVGKVLGSLRNSRFTMPEILGWHSSTDAFYDHWRDVLQNSYGREFHDALALVDEPNLWIALRKAFSVMGKHAPGWLRGDDDPNEVEKVRQINGLVRLTCDVWTRYSSALGRQNLLDFTEMEVRAVQLAKSSPVTLDRVRSQYRVVMVDESQDVNPLQHQILDLLQIEREMLVGDFQQSIYGFRQADPELFREKVGGHALNLTKNMRSDPGILQFVDHVFGNLWSSEYKPMGSQEFDLDQLEGPSCHGVEYWRHTTDDFSETANYVRQLVEEGESEKDISILVRKIKTAITIKQRLAKVGIEARIAGGSESYYSRIEVRDLANTLRAVADPSDDFALLACLRSPVVGLSLDTIVHLGMEPEVAERLREYVPVLPEDQPLLDAFRAWFLPLCAYADRLSAWEVLSEIFAKSDYLNALARRPDGAQLLANARKLMALATREPELGPLDYSDRIQQIKDIKHKEGDAPADQEDARAVTIMTVHKAKGLEWPIVILPDTSLSQRAGQDVELIDPRVGLIATSYSKGEPRFFRYLKERESQRSEAEYLRLLYVAMTRAEKRLCIARYASNKAHSVGKLLNQVLGDSVLPGIRVRDIAATTALKPTSATEPVEILDEA